MNLRALRMTFVVSVNVALFPFPAHAQNECTNLHDGYQETGSYINYSIDVGSDVPQDIADAYHVAIGNAAGRWKQCADGTTAPSLRLGTGKLTINLVHQESPSGGGDDLCGLHSGTWGDEATITIYTKEAGCTNYENIMLHEFGHHYGFGDSSGSACDTSYIMWPEQTSITTIHSAECSGVDLQFYTRSERNSGEEPPKKGTPLVFDLDGDGILTTNVDTDPVLFDLDGDGVMERVGWLSPEGDDSFLWIDLNDNGLVDNGSELFGDAAEGVSGAPAVHGFDALARYDLPMNGGNDDGKISPEDNVWLELFLWNDSDHDGVSRVGEITPVESAGIAWISLKYNKRFWDDASGNTHFRVGLYLKESGGPDGRRGTVEDIFFSILPAQ